MLEESTHSAASDESAKLAARFSPDFVLGVATAAFQIEGAADQDGRGDSIWDEFCRRPGAIADASNGLTACDHYHQLDADLDLIQSLGVSAYRFSVSWPRVQPLGQGDWNVLGFAFYDRLIEGLVKRGIAAHLTLYHWDLPQALEEQGGWRNPHTVECFVAYATQIGQRYGSRLASLCTFNEPWVVATLGHESGIFAPGLKDRKAATQVSHHLLLAHGKALLALRALGVTTKLGIVLNQAPQYPATASLADQDKARLDDGTLVRWYMDALFKASYPRDVLDYLGDDVPQIAAQDMQIISQPLDFIGINYYTRGVAATAKEKFESPYELTDMGWEIYPQGLYDLLVRLNTDYNLPAVYITENGAAFPDRLINGQVDDPARIRYLAQHRAAVADAIASGVNVRGYFVWSLMDNFEWASGYAKRFGIVYVDYASFKRTLKSSALWLRDFTAFHASSVSQQKRA